MAAECQQLQPLRLTWGQDSCLSTPHLDYQIRHAPSPLNSLHPLSLIALLGLQNTVVARQWASTPLLLLQRTGSSHAAHQMSGYMCMLFWTTQKVGIEVVFEYEVVNGMVNQLQKYTMCTTA